MSLLTTLTEKLKDLAYKIGHSKIVKGTLAFAMGLTIAIGASACGGAQTPDNPQDPDQLIQPTRMANIATSLKQFLPPKTLIITKL